jgi:predicted transcriptional regulator
MDASNQHQLSRREREIMEILYRIGSATVAKVRGEMASPPSYSAVRATLGILEGKGFLRHTARSGAYFYTAVTTRKKAMRSAVQTLLRTYFDGSVAKAVSALIELRGGDVSPGDLAKLQRFITQKKK